MNTKIKILLAGLLLVCFQPAFAQVEDEDLFVDNPKEEKIQVDNTFSLNNYRLGEGITFNSRTSSYRFNLTGYIQSGMQSTFYPDENEILTRYRVRRARIRLNGSVCSDKIRYRLGFDFLKNSETDLEGAGTYLSDAWIQYRPFKDRRFVLTFGQRGTPADNRELFTSSTTLQLADRSKLSSLFATSREVGVFAEGSYKVGEKSHIRPSVAITDGSGGISFGKRYSGMKYAARVNYLPFGLFRTSGESRESDMVHELSPKLIIGAAYSYANKTSDRRGGRDNGAILYKSYNCKDNEYDLPSMSKFTADFMFKYRGFSLLGEYVKTWAYIPSSIAIRVRDNGTETTTFPVDEFGNNGSGVDNIDAYIRNRMILGSAFNIQGGYMFRNFWSIDGRYTHLIPDEYSYMKNKTYYNRNNIYEIGAAKYFTRSYAVKVQATMQFLQSNGTSTQLNGKPFTGWEKNLIILLQLAF